MAGWLRLACEKSHVSALVENPGRQRHALLAAIRALPQLCGLRLHLCIRIGNLYCCAKKFSDLTG